MTRLEEFSETGETPADLSRHVPRVGHRADDYEALLSSVLYSDDTLFPERHSIGIVGCLPGTDTGTVAHNLAACAAACIEGRVLLVQANPATTTLHQELRLKECPGLMNYLLGEADLSSCVQPTQVERLSVITAGTAGRRWFRRRSERSSARFLDEVRQEYSLVVVDLAAVTQRRKIAPLAAVLDGIVLVVEAGRVRVSEARRAKRLLARASSRVCGVVVSDERRLVERRTHGRRRRHAR